MVNCLAHARRKFVECPVAFPEECDWVLDQYWLLAKHEKEVAEFKFDDNQRLAYHQEHSKPIMDSLFEWMNRQLDEDLVEAESSLGKAINYSLKRWAKLTLFLEIPGVPLDNNAAERGMKVPIRNRKNAMFYKSREGARVGDIYMSLIHTCELLGVDPFKYLTAALRHGDEVTAAPERWMPWNFGENRDLVTA